MTDYKRPIFRLSIDGVDITGKVTDRLISLTHTDNRGFEADQIDIELDDSDGSLNIPPRGAVASLAIGWLGDSGSTRLVDKGSFTVDEVSHTGSPDRLTIRARSADLRSGLSTQRERSWHDTTLGDIVRAIAGENALDPVIADLLDGQHIDHIDQTNESSANLLTRLGKMHDAIATVKNDKLLFAHAGMGLSASGMPLKRALIVRQSGDGHSFTLADRDNNTQVRATYNNIHTGQKGEVVWGQEQEDEALGREAKQTTPAVDGKPYKLLAGKPAKNRATAMRAARNEWKRLAKDQAFRSRYGGIEAAYDDKNLNVNGKAAYGQAEEAKKRSLAARRAQRDADASLTRAGAEPQVAIDAGADNVKTLRHVYASQENAKRAARAEWRRQQRGLAKFSITLATGVPELIAETPIEVRGFKKEIDSTDWIATRVVNTLGDGGYTTQVELEIKATELED